MEALEVIDVARGGIFVMLKTLLPILAVALGVGLVVSLFQALTQMQEMTLSFVPKIFAVFLSLLIFTPYMFDLLADYTLNLFDMIKVR